ncbi:MAG: hypothetical protein P4L16_08625 [Chlamydiales bacterium]|nr:hypothetical protein [Chlamydiales bacterium]
MNINSAINFERFSEGAIMPFGGSDIIPDNTSLSDCFAYTMQKGLHASERWHLLWLYPLTQCINGIMVAWHVCAFAVNTIAASVFALSACFASGKPYEEGVVGTARCPAYDKDPIHWSSNREGWVIAAKVNLEVAVAGLLYACILVLRVVIPTLGLGMVGPCDQVPEPA